MLKAIFLDLVPYVIQENKIFNKVWHEVLASEYQEFSKNERLAPLLNQNLVDPQVQQRFSELFANPIRSNEIIKNYSKTHAQIETYIFQTFSFSEPIMHLIEDAKNNQCEIIIITWHKEYLKRIKDRIKWDNVKTMIVEKNALITAQMLFDYCTKRNIAVDEFLCITQVEKTINDMVENNYFCATISALKSTNNNPYIISSLNDLHFENIGYNFYENVDDESEDL